MIQMSANRFKKLVATENSRRYWAPKNKLDVSDISGAQVAFGMKNKRHLNGVDSNLNVEDIVPKQSILDKNL